MRTALLFSILILAAIVVFATKATQNNTDEAAVRETVEHYLHGLKFNDVEGLKKAFYPEAKLFFVKRDGQLGQLTQEQWYKGFAASAGQEEKGDLQITAVDTTGNAAAVKVVEVYPNSKYTDYLSLLKFDGGWKIVNKIYVAEPLKH
ncbi:MAG TPA: nuclear transport factor 2 family protein [Pyrinomonadaceae bacterium]